jgi:hypothetical protein
MDDFIVNNEMKKSIHHRMKRFQHFIINNEFFLHFITNNEIIHRFWDCTVLGQIYVPLYYPELTIRRDAKIQKFDTKIKF